MRNLKELAALDFNFNRKSFMKDLLAGISVAVVALPLALGFGLTSGLSAASGLTTAIIAGFLAALFGGSRFQVSGPTGAMTVVLIPIVHSYGPSAIPLLGLLAGLMVIGMSIARAGNIINQIPWSVIEGFTVGIAFVIALQQLPLALGVVRAKGDRTLPVAFQTVKGAFETGVNWQVILVLVVTLIVKFSYPSITRKLKIKVHVPASFLAIVISLLIVQIISLNVPKIGDIPRSIGHWQGDQIATSDVGHLLWPAFLIALLCAIESLLSARVADGMVHANDSEKYQPNRELFGQGLGTLVASIFGGMPATGAIARTSVNVRSHAETRLASIFHAIVLLFVALVAAPWVSHIPAAAIAGVLIGTSYRILNPASIRESLRTTKTEASVIILTATATLAIDLIWGIAIGICLYFALHRKKRNKG